MEMGAPIDSTVELISSNSISKGLVGEGTFHFIKLSFQVASEVDTWRWLILKKEL